jgi:hypothetical protein
MVRDILPIQKVQFFILSIFNANSNILFIPLAICFKILFLILFLLYYCQNLTKGKNNHIYRNN